MDIIRDARPDFQVLVGSAQVLLPSLLMGAVGGILAFANPAPYAAIAIWEAFRTREEEAARDWQNRVGRAATRIAKYGVPGLKHVMDVNGYYGGPPRLPLSVPTPEAKREIEEAFKDLKG
jgi:4-hydroxy-2-oxoglutarate aldolase